MSYLELLIESKTSGRYTAKDLPKQLQNLHKRFRWYDQKDPDELHKKEMKLIIKMPKEFNMVKKYNLFCFYEDHSGSTAWYSFKNGKIYSYDESQVGGNSNFNNNPETIKEWLSRYDKVK